ncbi:hypothetical protein ACFC1R_15325 [Kitasatospora sp. NPDC056138]|uniref:hypothetical protein n=1 Tax=Kitasatospora sp. NPDC056138 TaxID=3345724 RepID=UPI0035DC24FA
MSKVKDLQNAQSDLKDLGWFDNDSDLLDIVHHALGVGGPAGSPASVRERAKAYADAAAGLQKASDDLNKVAGDQLPQAWKGAVAENAGQAISALASEFALSQQTLTKAAAALNTWADDLERGQREDPPGCDQLHAAEKGANKDDSWFDVSQTPRDAADNGIATRLRVAQYVEAGGTETASTLNQLASQARAERMGGGSSDPLSAVVLANAQTDAGKGSGTSYILTDNQLTRANQVLAGMSPSDQARFKTLLANAKSPEEAAFLRKALAAGHSMDEVEQFDGLIHPHGDDPAWLAQHLVPATDSDSTDGRHIAAYDGQNSHPAKGGKGYYNFYSQGGTGDCVAASTVIAQARLDPTLMLNLTTGNTPDVPGADSPDNFQHRLEDYYVGQYIQGQTADGQKQTYPKKDNGIGPKGENALANQDISTATGVPYEHVGLSSADDRRNALSRIDNALDQGLPVPINVNRKGSKEGHQMVIIGRDGDRLEVYNPWGFTEWVTADQFVNSQLGNLTDKDNLDTAVGLELPK